MERTRCLSFFISFLFLLGCLLLPLKGIGKNNGYLFGSTVKGKSNGIALKKQFRVAVVKVDITQGEMRNQTGN